MKKMIVILGATSHIAKGLIVNFMQSNGYGLCLFSRIPKKVKDFLEDNSLPAPLTIDEFKHFQKREYDVVINCVGLGTPVKVKEAQGGVFRLTEEFDNMVLGYLSGHPKTVYINFSSGAVYGVSFNNAVDDDASREIAVNSINPQDYYGIAKFNSEAKHRAQDNLAIVDIRIFSYFSRFIDLDSGFFITELIKSIKRGGQFITNPCDFTRDYLNPADLFALIELIIAKGNFNAAIDAYSQAPVTKFELLDYFCKAHGLKYKTEGELDLICPTGVKNIYCSNSRRAFELLGYHPRYSSIRTVKEEAEFLLD